MWSKITNVLKPHQPAKETAPASSQSEVLNKVYEQHPNMSMFHANETGVIDTSSDPPPSPSIHNKRSMFKRMSRAPLKEDLDLQRAPSPYGTSTASKKVRNQFDSNFNGSQLSLGPNVTETRSSPDIPRRSSYDMLRPSPNGLHHSQDTTRSVKDTRRRPSIDFLRQETSRPSQESLRMNDQQLADAEFLSTPGGNDRFNSKRSILRDRNTPGTGQNVRFIGRDAYKVITPDQSLSTELQEKPPPPTPQDYNPFVDRLTEANANDSPQSLTRSHSASSSKPSRPNVAEIFAAMNPPEVPNISVDQSADMSISSFPQFVVEDNSNLFNVSQQLDIPSFPPPGLGFDVNAPFSSPSLNCSGNDDSQLLAEGGLVEYSEHMTSTPYRKDDKGKGKEIVLEDFPAETNIPTPEVIDETIFHSQEKSPKLPAPLHERSQSFSFGQTLFYSMANSGGDANKSTPDSSAAYPSSDLKPESVNSSATVPTPPSSGKVTRNRAMSDTVFQTMLRSKNIEPEADINDESSSGLVVYSGGPSEPDPFSANANTYYTPQTMIPVTPPKGSIRHNRKTSKEESLIISLQTQLALKSELCSQYETDLKARDELVDLLTNKLSDAEKEETKRKNALRSWKRKVQELERACRQLEEAVEDSRQESMERSVMDEASGEALRMLHRQIASLEREKTDWVKKEATLQQEVETLEALVRDRSEDIINLKESLWTHDESKRELEDGIREAKEQIDMMGNISLGFIDEEELKKLMLEKDQKSAEETQRFRTVEFQLKQELEELKLKYEGLEVQKANWEEQLEHLNQLLKTRDEEHATLKSELEAQWQHTENASDKIESLEKEKAVLVEERDGFKSDFEELETRASNMEAEWTENENKRNELESELQEVWNAKDLLEKDREELEDALRHEQEHIEQLAQEIEERDRRISELEQEHQFANENVARLQENMKQRDAEVEQYTQRLRAQEAEAEVLREQMSKLNREHQHLVDEQTRALEDVTGQHDQTQSQMQELVRMKAEIDVELKASRERVIILQEEVERQRRQIHILQQESADKDIKLLQGTKQHSQDKEDLQGLNIALDSKQQELELIKRKLGLRGTAGSTPAQASKIAHRRDSSVFNATPISRPSSVISDSGTDAAHDKTIKKERKNSMETLQSGSGFVQSRVNALGKSTRINGSANATSASATTKIAGRSSVEGSMGPPPLKSRSSIIGTPTPSARTPTPSGRISSLSRSSSVVSPPPARTPVPHRRGSSVASAEQTSQTKSKLMRAPSTPSSVPEEREEKENVDTSSLAMRKRTMISNPA